VVDRPENGLAKLFSPEHPKGKIMKGKIILLLAQRRELNVAVVEINTVDEEIGEQPIHLLAPDTAFAFTGVTADRAMIQEHQLCFLEHALAHFS
jgi:hypothetical protein